MLEEVTGRPQPAPPQTQAPTEPAMMQEGGSAMGGEVSPEEQAQYDRLVANGMNLIYEKKTLPGLLEVLEGQGDPIQGLVEATTTIWARVATSADQSGFKMSGDAMFHGGRELFEHLADVSTKAGIHDFENDPDGLEGAFFRALDDFRMMMTQAGRLNQDAAKQDLSKLQAMDESGDLEKMFLGLAEKGEAKAAPAQEAPRTGLNQGAM